MAIPTLLKMLMSKGCMVTIDTMGPQKRIARTIRDRSVDYVLVFKGDQSQLTAHLDCYEATVRTLLHRLEEEGPV